MVTRRRILVAEPDAVTRRLLLRLLERLGHEVNAVGSAREAVAAAATGGHDLVLVTHAPGDLDPAALARAIRAQGQRVTVVALAEDVSPDQESAWRAAGVAEWLIKPVRAGDLARLVTRLPSSATVPVDPEAVPPPPVGLAVQEMLKTRFWDATPFYAEMLSIFVSTSWKPLAGMRAALTSGAWEALRAGAHFVTGGALSVGAVLAAHEARAIEEWTRAAEGDPGRETARAAAHLDTLERTIHEIERYAAQLTHWASREEGR